LDDRELAFLDMKAFYFGVAAARKGMQQFSGLKNMVLDAFIMMVLCEK